MAIPLTYNLRSLRVRWSASIVAVVGIAGTVSVFVAMLALASGFKATLVASGSPQNVIIRRAGASSEMESAVTLDQVRILEDAPGVARGPEGPRVSPEVVVISSFPLKATGSDANLQVRGVGPRVLSVRTQLKITSGRMFKPGLNELVVGSNVAAEYSDFALGARKAFGGGTWTVVGVFDAGGSAFDSEIWCDAAILNPMYSRPQNVFQSATLRLESADAFQQCKDALTADPRLTIQIDREAAYYEKQSRSVTTLIVVLGGMVAAIMGIGAVFGALNTMYSALADRSREIATMRALGFGAGAVVMSFLFESVCVALLGGVIGCIIVLPLNGVTTGTMNWQTFSHMAFAFRVTPQLLGGGLFFSVVMGILGGVPPAITAARSNISVALREL
jgi:putative ABC transport system permease protein